MCLNSLYEASSSTGIFFKAVQIKKDQQTIILGEKSQGEEPHVTSVLWLLVLWMFVCLCPKMDKQIWMTVLNLSVFDCS